jgi:predicted RNase H-like HicB family nuclease
MKTTIPCKITYSEEDKCWYVEAPGFYDGIMTYGDTLEEAKKMAAEAAEGLLKTYLEHDFKFDIPVIDCPSDWHEIELAPALVFALQKLEQIFDTDLISI